MRQDGTEFYEDKKMYDVSVIDMLSPEMNVFTCGLNGDVREYPTKKQISLSGAQIKMLMTCAVPEEETENVDGLNQITGHSEYPRFAITLRGLGQMPTEKARILSKPEEKPAGAIFPGVTMSSLNPVVDEPEEEPLTADELEAMDSEPKPDRRSELEGATREELVRYATEMGITVGPRNNRETIIRAILKAED